MVIAVLAEAEHIATVGISVFGDNAEWISIALMQNRKRRRTNDNDDTLRRIYATMDSPHDNGMEMV